MCSIFSASINGSESGTTIPCASLPAPHTSLTWRFNHSHTILKQNGSSSKVSDGWTQHVEISSESTDLTLKDLSSAQEGIYTCELSNSEETYVANTFLRVQTSPGERQENLHGPLSPDIWSTTRRVPTQQHLTT